MKLGTEEKKKVYILAGLGVAAAYLFYTNVLSGPGTGSLPAPSRPAAAIAPSPSQVGPAAGSTPPAPRRAAPGAPRKGDDFRPVLRSRRPEDRLDPASIDPTLRLDLFAKVQKVEFGGGGRNVFQFGAPPPPKPKDLGPEPIVAVGGLGKMQDRPWTLEQYQAANKPKPDPPKPPPPPINLKYYGFSSSRASNRKTAFFLDGEEILVAAEGETVKKRYKVVRINVNSVVMQDTVANSEQSLPMLEDLPGAG